jgi:hypothetical protein
MTATTNSNNAIMGPLNLWYGVFGATEPAQTNAALIADPGAGWTFGGGTKGGIDWEIDYTYQDITFDQQIDPVSARVIGRNGLVTFNAAEPTLAMLQLAMDNLGTITVGSGISIYNPGQPNSGTPLTFAAILLDGWAPLLGSGAAARRRAIFRKMLNQSKLVTSGDPTKQQSWTLPLKMYGVSPSIDPYVVMDQTA